MAPSPKKAKKKKKTKAELEAERLQKEEEERLEREAEEKRKEEERQRLEKEARNLEERRLQYRKEELEWLAAEDFDYSNEVAARRALLEATERREREAHEWTTFLACAFLPNPDNDKVLETYLTQIKDLTLKDIDACVLGLGSNGSCTLEDDSMMRALRLGNQVLEVLTGVLDVISERIARGERGSARRHMTFVKRLCEVQLDKIDDATREIIHHSDLYDTHDEKKGIMALREIGPTRYAIWVNSAIGGSGARYKPLDFLEVGMFLDIPKPIQQNRMAVRCLYYPYDFVSTFAESASSQEGTHRSLGGLFLMHLLDIPPELKVLKGWVLKVSPQNLLENLEHKPYPLDGSGSVAIQPFKCQYRVPESIVLPADPMVAWWEPTAGKWNTEMVTDTMIAKDPKEGTQEMLKFSCVRVGAFSLIQDRILDFPYKSWSLEPVYDLHKYARPEDWVEEAKLSIETQRFQVEIQIKANKCRLLKPELPSLKHLLTQEFKPGVLLQKLYDAGINLMPTDADASRVYFPEEASVLEELAFHPEERPATEDLEAPSEDQSEKSKGIPVELKHPNLENQLCEELSFLAASFDFQSSSWSQGRGSSQAVFQLRESSVFTGNNTETLDFMTCLMERDEASESHLNSASVGVLPQPGVKCSLIKTTETMKKFVTAIINNDKTYVYLFNAVKNYVTPEAAERVVSSSVQFQQAVKQFLYLTRPFSFN